MKKYNGKYYLGLDIGTDSVGYAVTDDQYNILKFHGEPAWGTTIFDNTIPKITPKAQRRAFRTARRRLDRRKQRRNLLQNLFAEEISKVDPKFFIRLNESRLFREDVGEQFSLFNDIGFTDKEYYDKYPTIHHLLVDLMHSREPHDVRLVYLACAWLITHRGHFLSNISVDNIEEIRDFNKVYNSLINYFVDNGFKEPWICDDTDTFASILKEKTNISEKYKKLSGFLFKGSKPPKNIDEYNPINRELMIKLLCGSTVKIKDIFGKEDYAEAGSVSLGMDDDKLAEIAANIGDDFEIISVLRLVYDWTILSETIDSYNTISEAKVGAYEQHKNDLRMLKDIIRKYTSKKVYNSIFRDIEVKENYPAYVYHTDEENVKGLKKIDLESFSKFVLGKLKEIDPEDDDKEILEKMIMRLNLREFLPKQKTTNNRVIPSQLYHYELRTILRNAEKYLAFLSCENDGMTVSDKIESIFKFKIPYFVGPLNSSSEFAWLKREAGKIYPWNFERMVDLDESENNFIKRMTNTCTYIPGEAVLPKDSLAYHKYMVLNEINNIRINGERISVELKQNIYNDVFMFRKNVTRKALMDYLLCNGYINKGEEDLVTGIGESIHSNLTPQIAFKRLMNSKLLSEADVEAIIERSTYAEDKSRLARWIEKKYPHISDEDRKYICRIKIKDFGRLSRKFLCEIEGLCRSSGEVYTVMSALWNTQDNLMEILSSKYTFVEALNSLKEIYYSEHSPSLNDRLDEMRVSDPVKRSIYRTLAIVKDVEKAFGMPAKVFLETTRGATEEHKNKKTTSRKQQILELYKKCNEEDVRLLKQQLEAMGIYADNKLRGDKLFLYFMQLGKCMYSGEPISLEKLGAEQYNIDHIYPQSYVKDDSILNNKVLVLSAINGKKDNRYPIDTSIRQKMTGYWKHLREINLITDEKYKRLTRSTSFSENEKIGFINRQLVETSQANKIVAELLKERFVEAEIVYCKARLVSDFRQAYGLLKSRTFNDLHHAKDAYLNIVTGNVYSMKFTKNWFNPTSKYSLKTTTLFDRPLVCNGVTVWDGDIMLKKVINTVGKNNAHFTKYAYFKHGGLFDQMPVPAGDNLVPLKAGLDTAKYGGYNGSGAMFFIPVRYKVGKKTNIIIMSVEMRCGDKFLADYEYAKEYSYSRLEQIIGKRVESLEFPMGMRPWKVNIMLELDGFRVCIAGSSGKGKRLIAQPVMQFTESKKWNDYLKRIERLVEKASNNKNYIYDSSYDKVDKTLNEELYTVYLNKYRNSIFSKRYNSPLSILEKGEDTFKSLDVMKQAEALLHIHETFGRLSSGCDLSLIGGAGRAASTVNFSSTVSNWAKNYNSVRIVDSSASGLWTSYSSNILELL